MLIQKYQMSIRRDTKQQKQLQRYAGFNLDSLDRDVPEYPHLLTYPINGSAKFNVRC